MQPAVTKGFASDANHRAPSSPVPMYLRRADAASVQAQAWAHRPAQPACPRAAVPRGRNPHASPCGVEGPAANARIRARRGVPTTTPRPAADAMDPLIDAM